MAGFWGYFTVAVVCYFLGNLNFSIIFSKYLLKADVRKYGSKNAGSTNAFRTFGLSIGTFVLLCDFTKGIAAIFLAQQVIMTQPNIISGFIAGLFVVIGHIYPVLFNFKGGKGVATAAGSLFMADWQSFICGFYIFLIILLLTGYMSLASVSLLVIIPTVTFLVNLLVYSHSFLYCGFAAFLGLIMGLVIVFSHRGNIERLINGTENKLIKRNK